MFIILAIAYCKKRRAVVRSIKSQIPIKNQKIATDKKAADARSQLAETAGAQKINASPNQVIIKFKKKLNLVAGRDHLKSVKLVRSYKHDSNLHLLEAKQKMSVKDIIKLYSKNPDVQYVEPNYIYRVDEIPNDPKYTNLWGLHNLGQVGGTVDADMNVPEAWEHIGSGETYIGVIDTGVDYLHEDLKKNLWVNPNEIAGNNIDDDENGYVDDIYGINVVDDNGDPLDGNGHGTHVTGIIAATYNNAIGITGIVKNVKIITCKYMSDDGFGYLADIFKCLNYFNNLKTKYNIDIVATNNSWGSYNKSIALEEAIQLQMDKGILFVAAAGNDGVNVDEFHYYPSSYHVPNVLAVAAFNRNDSIAYFSNYGIRTVHVAAPGVSIYSTMPNDQYTSLDGTSMAAPHVTGLVGLLKIQNQNRDWKKIKNLVITGGKKDDIYLKHVISSRRVRAWDEGGVGSMSCSNQKVTRRTLPIKDKISVGPEERVNLEVLHLDCDRAAGSVTVDINEGQGQVILEDVNSTGYYSNVWTPSDLFRHYRLDFPQGDVLEVEIIDNYLAPDRVVSNFRNIEGDKLFLLYDEETVTLETPFPIKFAGSLEGYNEVIVAANGGVSFTNRMLIWDNVDFPIPDNHTLVVPFWDDLVPGEGGGVFAQTLGISPNRELVIEWRHVPHYEEQCSGDVTFQIVLFEDSPNILFNYKDVVFGTQSCDKGGSATIGIQVSPSVARKYSFNNDVLQDGSSLLWKIPDEESRWNIGDGSSPDDGGPENHPPVVNIENDFLVQPGSNVVIRSEVSDPENQSLTLRWTQTNGENVITGDVILNQDQLEFVAPTEPSILNFTLTAIDPHNKSGTDSITIIVSPNLSPVARINDITHVGTGQLLELDGRGSFDRDGRIVKFTWSQIMTGSSANLQTINLASVHSPVIQFNAPAVEGVFAIKLTVEDEGGLQDSTSVEITIVDPPIAVVDENIVAVPGQSIQLDGSNSEDPAGGMLIYHWRQVGGPLVELVDFTQAEAGFEVPVDMENTILTFLLVVTNSNGISSKSYLSVTVNH